MKDWSIKGRELSNCNCNYGCPCQFGVLPTKGNCEALIVYDIEKGHYGDTKLDGLRAAGIYKWPGAIHEGNGECQLIIDERADSDQREALEAIMSGKDTEEMATMWFVFSAMSPNKHPALTAPIELDWDQDERSGHAKVGDVFSIEVAPIPNIVTGAPHRISIQLPHGFEFRHAEMASGSGRTGDGPISLEFTSTHAHLANLHLTGQGVVAARARQLRTMAARDTGSRAGPSSEKARTGAGLWQESPKPLVSVDPPFCLPAAALIFFNDPGSNYTYGL